MYGSDYFIAGSHPIGLPQDLAAIPALDPTLSKLEQLKVPASGWTPDMPAGVSKIVYIDPSAGSYGDGTAAHPFNSWNNVTWSPGTEYLQKAGTVSTTPIIVTGSGTAGAPIVLGSYGSGQATVQSSVVFDNAHYVAMDGLNITSPYSAVLVQNGSSHIEIAGNTISNSGVGITIASSAGGQNLIEGNNIYGNAFFGVGAAANNAAGNETVIIANSIHDNGSHGIELNGDRYIVENNYVAGNGIKISGSSGIHTYAAEAAQDAGSYNVIRYNYLLGNHDATAQDGNGIELDQYTNHNTVFGNLTYGNDGAGIVAYDSFNNIIQDNTLAADQQDPGRTHSAKGELVLAGPLGLTTANTILNNTAVATTESSFAVIVSSDVNFQSESFANNDYLNFSGGSIYYWDGSTGSNVDAWHALTGSSDVFGFMPF